MNRLARVRYLIRRLALLLNAGLGPQRIWQTLSSDRHVGQIALNISRDAAAGASIPSALASQGLTALAALWQVAEIAGAPMSATLSRLAVLMDAQADATRKRDVAFAAPRATMRLVMLLPVIGIAFAFLLGFNPLETLFLSPPGWALLFIGATLMLLGYVWSTRLISRAAGSPSLPGFELEVMTIALTGGANIEAARLNAVNALDQFRVPGASIATLLDSEGAVSAALHLSALAGVSIADILRVEADEVRLEYAAQLDEAAERLGVQLMIPLGVCVLPAFIVLSVLPMMISIFSQTAFS